MKLLHVFLLPRPGWVASLSQGYPLYPSVRQDPLIHPGGERHYDISVSCPRTQHNVFNQGFEPGPVDPELSALSDRASHEELQ